MRRLLVLLAALGVVAGCSTSVAGTPAPEAGAASSRAGDSGLVLPPRPRELKLDGLDPCSSLTPARLAKLGLDQTVPSIPTDPAILVGKICTASAFNTKQVDVSVVFVTHPGIEYITAGPTASLGKFEQVQVSGFPGVIEPQQKKDVCAVDLDTAAGQFINIQYQDATVPPVLSRAELCQSATSVGEEVIQSLLEK
jgi:hypothetical protein